MRNKSDARDRILMTASRLFQRQGYHATGLNQIIAESDAPKGSLYYYFPNGKEELAVAAIKLTRDTIGDKIKRFLQKADDPVEAIQELVCATAREVEQPEKIIPCTISLLALETSLTSEALREACRDTYVAWGNAFTEKLTQSGYDQEEARELGALIQLMIDGALISSLTKKDTRPLLYVARQIPVLLQSGRTRRL